VSLEPPERLTLGFSQIHDWLLQHPIIRSLRASYILINLLLVAGVPIHIEALMNRFCTLIIASHQIIPFLLRCCNLRVLES
jgi:hypothetical protein